MKDKIIEQFKFAFKEQMLVKGFFGIKPGRYFTELFWEKELLPKVQWRLEKLFEKEKEVE